MTGVHSVRNPSDEQPAEVFGYMVKIYVGNLNFRTTEDSIRELFAQYGSVSSVALITDRETGRPRGFGFVEMDNESDARKAIDSLNGQDFDGRALNVNEARPKTGGGGGGGDRGPRGGGGGGGGFRGGRGGGDRGDRGGDRGGRW